MTTATRFYKGDLVTVDSAADGVFDAVVERMDGDHVVVWLPEDLVAFYKRAKGLYPTFRVRPRVPAAAPESSSNRVAGETLETYSADAPEALLPVVEAPMVIRTWTHKACGAVVPVPDEVRKRKVIMGHIARCPMVKHATTEQRRAAGAKGGWKHRKTEVVGIVGGTIDRQATHMAPEQQTNVQPQSEPAMPPPAADADGFVRVKITPAEARAWNLGITPSPGTERVLARLERIAEMVEYSDNLDPAELTLTGREIYGLLLLLENARNLETAGITDALTAFLFALMERPYGMVSIRGAD